MGFVPVSNRAAIILEGEQYASCRAAANTANL
jgi:hypothetical protein